MSKKLFTKSQKNIMANRKDLKGNWYVQRAELKKKFPVLTDIDLLYQQGQKEVMLEKLQTKLGMSKEELEKIIAAL